MIPAVDALRNSPATLIHDAGPQTQSGCWRLGGGAASAEP
jgi:hypothetical protein